MKIVSWNINSVRLRIDALGEVLSSINPDVICLQETKATNDVFPFDQIKSFGYEHIIASGEKSYNGVAIISKHPIISSFSLELYNEDKRHIAAMINDIEIHNFYVPAGGDIPNPDENPKFAHKLAFIDEMNNWFLENRSKEDKLILVGDLNISPFEHDVWSSKQLRNIVSHSDIEREKLLRNIESFNWIDTHRKFTDHSEKLYSWWSYRSPNWQKSNRGRRLDHIWVSKNLDTSLKSASIYKETRSWEKPSDHVPVITELK